VKKEQNGIESLRRLKPTVTPVKEEEAPPPPPPPPPHTDPKQKNHLITPVGDGVGLA
jgi:hypothetical protein